jgi:hypothetical protein
MKLLCRDTPTAMHMLLTIFNITFPEQHQIMSTVPMSTACVIGWDQDTPITGCPTTTPSILHVTFKSGASRCNLWHLCVANYPAIKHTIRRIFTKYKHRGNGLSGY